MRMHFIHEVCTRPEGRRPNVESLSRTFLLQDAVFQEQMFFTTQQEAEIRLSTMICDLAGAACKRQRDEAALGGRWCDRLSSASSCARECRHP